MFTTKIGALVLIAAAPFAAAPAAAAPAVAATPELVISQITGETPCCGAIATGTFTCSAPSGEAVLQITGIQFRIGQPASIGVTNTPVWCAAGPVPYSVSVAGALGFEPGGVFVTGRLIRDGVVEATAGAHGTI